jgi:hypothetical protein
MVKRTTLWVALAAAAFVAIPSVAVLPVDFGPLTVGVHLIPAVEGSDEGRNWDMSLSLGMGLTLDEWNRFEVHALTDSHLTSLGLTALYFGGLSESLSAGAGLTVLWPLGENQQLLKPVLEAFAHGTAEFRIGPVASGDVGVSFPLVAVAYRIDRWDVIALAELPSLSASVDAKLEADTFFRSQLTLQPVVIDTTVLERPIGRIGENLLVLPTISNYLRFLP